MSPATLVGRIVRTGGAVLLGGSWIGLGLLVGWFVGYLADELALPSHHVLIYLGLALSAAVLSAWAYGTRLLYLEVRAGIDEATAGAGTRRRTGYAWAAALAGPIVGLLIGWSSHAATHVARGQLLAPGGASFVAALKPPAVHATPAARAPATSVHVVAPGETLPAIARTLYGAGAEWRRLAAANAGRRDPVSGARLVDPSLVPGGMALEVPPAVGTTEPVAQDTISASVSGAGTGTAAAVRAGEIAGLLGGFGLLGGALLAARLDRLRRYQRMRAGPGAMPPRLGEDDARLEAGLRPLTLAELPRWIDAANRLLGARLAAGDVEPPPVSVVRAGPLGLELLLDCTRAEAPAGFVASADGRCWRLDPALELDELRAAAAGAQPYLAALVPVAEDDSGSYLVACGPGESLAVRGSAGDMVRALGAVAAHLVAAPWAEVACYRVGPVSFVGGDELVELSPGAVERIDTAMQRAPLWRVGLPDCQPVVLVEDPSLADEVRRTAPGIVAVIGTMLEADRTLFYEGASVTIEPLGLVLPARLPEPGELEAVARISAAANRLPAPPPQGALPERAPLGTDPATVAVRADVEPAEAARPLPSAGAVEVRLLRAIPDLVGDVDEEGAHPEVVQLVAYLVLHQHRASTARLRDVFGRYRREESRASRTIWNATSRARAVLGADRFPAAHGGRPYTLDTSVSCDWLRLRAIATAASRLAAAGRPGEAIETYRVALELVGDGYPCSDDTIAARYDWLDAEQVLVEMESVVVRAAYEMAKLAIEHRCSPRDLEDAQWAIGRGRVISPEALPLREAALLLAAAREDAGRLASEFLAAVDAVDDLELGLEIDPSLESTYRRLLARTPAPTSSR